MSATASTRAAPTSTATAPLRLGTRASALAMAQSKVVADAVTAHSGRPVTLVEISTRGDRSGAAISELGSTGVFVSALRDRLIAGDIDLAVHSYKDLPSAPAPGLMVAAIPSRRDPRDVLVSRTGIGLDDLGAGARVGTGAPRRIAQLRALGRGIEPVPVRGNVDTRLSAVAVGDLDALVLARAGLLRLGRADVATEVLEPDRMLPAPAQGALAVECRTADTALVGVLAALDDPASRTTVTAERAMLAGLNAGCTAPVAALAEITREAGDADVSSVLTLRGSVTALDGSTAVARVVSGTCAEADAIGRRLAADLIAAGAFPLL